MKIEYKSLSEKEILFYFETPLKIIGTAIFIENSEAPQMLKNIATLDKNIEMLLTKDFLYINVSKKEFLEDTKILAAAEIEDFNIENTSLTLQNNNLEATIRLLLKSIIAPFLQKDGGDIEFVSCNNNIVTVHFLGKCQNCPYAQNTLKERVEKNLIKYLPQIEKVILV